MRQQTYKVGVYCRLSRDDDANSESASISTQKAMITKYVQENGWEIVDYYVDDGVSGVTFQRPDFIRMINDIDQKRVNMVITKDLSRLGRDYILTGHYVEVYFPQKNVRYIALNDGIDTIHDNNDIAPFKNLINELYAKDASKKVRSALKTKAAQGMFLGSYPPYGYMRDPSDKHKLLVDEESAAVVRRIFQMYLKGMGMCGIAKTLTYEHVDTPMKYNLRRYPETLTSLKWQREMSWALCTVRGILKNIVYLGHMVNCKQTTKSFKCREIIHNDRSKWIIVENMHKAIIEQEQFDEAQRFMEHRRRPTKAGTPHMFSGLLRCSDCCKCLTLNNNGRGRRYFTCRTYKQLGTRFCDSHAIQSDVLVNLVLEDIKYHAGLVRFDKNAILDKLTNEDSAVRQGRVKGVKIEVSKILGREAEIDNIFKQLYEDKIKGTITDSRFIFLTEQYDSELEALKHRREELLDTLAKEEITQNDTSRFMEIIEKYADIKELDSEIVHELIDRIYVGKRDKSGREVIQEVRIVYKFVGEIA